ncbi:MAG: hypoxanthine phosphoribosyltransferase [Defluviitaleaceae bacterium]|nr:hypoxanthine phosphoribosyltransferase [Defluviitaleaceae bacterium]
MENIVEMISQKELADRVQELAGELNDDYEGRQVVLICLLKGAAMFMADLMRHITFDITTEYMEIASYSSNEPTGKIQLIKDIGSDIAGRDVIVIEDIIDTGGTLKFVDDHLTAKNPASVAYCVLLDNPVRRQDGCLNPDYTGFTIPNRYVFGYGLDHDGNLRNLPYVAALTV